MTRRLLLAVSPGEMWAALVDNDELAALRLLRTQDGARAGDLYLGRVVALRPEIPAVMVDIGEERPGFLGGASTLRDGEAVIVKVTKAARADKAPTVTMKLTPDERFHAAVPPGAAPPLRLHRHETALAELLRDFADADEIVVDDSAALAEIKRGFAGTVTLHTGATLLLEAEGVAAAVNSATVPRVALASGGAIIIELTEAAILIDVDGGRAGALAANLAAAREIARQIALRDLSGPIVIDFISMTQRDRRARVETALKQALGKEPDYLGWTRLGHYELARPRRRPSLSEMLFDAAGQKTPLTVALETLRRLQRESRAAPGKRFALRVHPDIAACFDGAARGARQELERRLGYALKIAAEPRPRDDVAIEPALAVSSGT